MQKENKNIELFTIKQTVISSNFHRRHLTISQRALIAAKLSNMRQGERTDLPSFDGKLDQERVASDLKVSIKSVERAKKVLDTNNEELIKEVENNKITVSIAYQKIKTQERKEQQQEAFENSSKSEVTLKLQIRLCKKRIKILSYLLLSKQQSVYSAVRRQ